MNLARTAPLLSALLLASPWAAARADNGPLLEIFEKRCAECHGDGEDTVLHAGINLVALHGTEGAAEDILERVKRPDAASGRMPKSGKPGKPGYVPPLTAEEIAVIEAFVKNGPTPASAPSVTSAPVAPAAAKEEASAPAARGFIPLREETARVAADLASVDAAKQRFTRYLTLANLHNAKDAKGDPLDNDEQLDAYRAAVSKLINSLSHAGRIAVPVAVDAERTLLRIDLRDYGWKEEDWESYVVRAYPYALRGIDGRAEREIERLSGSRSAWVRADWFVFATSQPPLYHDLLRLPRTEQELEKSLGVDTLANLRVGEALRAGFRASGVSQGNRLIERHEAAAGMYWKSYDFSPLVREGGHDLFRSPLGPVGAGLTKNKDREFVHDGGEMIFALPNGLHGYYLATAKGERIDRGPTEIVQDRKRRDGAILNGISCMACHNEGMKYTLDKPIEDFIDEVGPVALKAGLDRDEVHLVRDLYQSQEKLHAAVLADGEAYGKALSEATPGYGKPVDPVVQLYNRFRQDVRLETLPAEFGVEDASFLKALADSRDLDLESIASQFEAGLGFPRASWLDQFKKIAHALDYELLDFHAPAYAEFTSGAASAGGNEGATPLLEGGRLTLATDKASYTKGELLTLRMKLTEGAYVRLYHLAADKTVTQIFPNAAQTDNFVAGGKEVVIGTKKEGTLDPGEFRFRMKEPFGTEIILAVASPTQFTDTGNLTFAQGEVFKTFAETDLREAPRRGTKGLSVETHDPAGNATGEKSAPVFTARAVFTVAP